MSKYKSLSQRYASLENDTQETLISLIYKSKINSKFTCGKCIKVNVFDYTELIMYSGELTFLDSDGLHYGLYNECSLEDLIDILQKI